QGDDLARVDLEVHLVQGPNGPEALREPPQREEMLGRGAVAVARGLCLSSRHSGIHSLLLLLISSVPRPDTPTGTATCTPGLRSSNRRGRRASGHRTWRPRRSTFPLRRPSSPRSA